VVSVITQRTAPHRNSTGTCGLVKKINTVLIACGTPATCRWLPQARELTTFFAMFLSNGKRLRCGALRYGMMETTRKTSACCRVASSDN